LLPGTARADDARQILLNSIEPKVATYVGEQVSEVLKGDEVRPPRKRMQVQRVYRKGKTLRIEYPDGRIFFDDGDQQFLYNSRQSIVEQGPSSFNPRKLQQQRQAVLRGRVMVESLPDDTAAGRPTYVLQVRQPKGARTVWVDKQTYVQLRQDVQQNNRVVSTYFRSIEFREPPADKLAYTPPPGVPVVERGAGRPVPPAEATEMARAWGGLLQPKAMPPGFALRGYFRHRLNGQPVLVALYAGLRGGKTLSMFQGPTQGTGSMAERQRGNLRVLGARKGQADVILVAPLAEEELQRIMNSVAPQ
jgi:hypothetical protein